MSSGGQVASNAVFQLRRTAFDPARVRILPRGDVALVMDRVSGRWLTLASPVAPLLPLLGASPADLPVSIRRSVASLESLIVEHGVGVPGSERHFGSLNTIILKLTNGCNYACTYCYDYERFERATTLSPALAEQALAEALELVVSDLWVILHGGEPMLMWELIERLVTRGQRLAQEQHKRIHFVGQTNLSRLNDRVVAFSEEHGIVWGISVDGPADVHDRHRVTHRAEGTYSHFAQALARYPAFVRRCGVMSTITTVNQGRLLEIARHFRDLGMGSWDWSLFQPIGRGRADAGRFAIDTEVLLEAWDQLFDAVHDGEFDGFPVLPVKKYLDNFIAGPGGNMCMRGECGAGRDLLSISATGAIEACDCIDPTGPLSGLGDLRTSSLAAARSTPTARRIRNRDLRAAPCADCIWFGVCGGSCLAHAPSLDEVWAEGCAVSMRAFDRISDSVVRDNGLTRYLGSVAPQ